MRILRYYSKRVECGSSKKLTEKEAQWIRFACVEFNRVDVVPLESRHSTAVVVFLERLQPRLRILPGNALNLDHRHVEPFAE